MNNTNAPKVKIFNPDGGGWLETKYVVDGKEMVLEEGDSVYFDATKQHGMQALNDKKAKFLAIII